MCIDWSCLVFDLEILQKGISWFIITPSVNLVVEVKCKKTSSSSIDFKELVHGKSNKYFYQGG